MPGNDKRELFEERVAIMIHDGHLEQSEAERRARKIVEGRADEPEQIDLELPEYKRMLQEFYKR
jgi:hypothetical protein